MDEFQEIINAMKGDSPTTTQQLDDPKTTNMENRLDIDKLVSRFLSWKLPKNFSPDAGISFKADYNENTPWPGKHEPIGTNLFCAYQAREMLEYVLQGEAPAVETPTNWGGDTFGGFAKMSPATPKATNDAERDYVLAGRTVQIQLTTIKELEAKITEQAARIAELEAERDQWKDDAMNGGNAQYLREQVSALTSQRGRLVNLVRNANHNSLGAHTFRWQELAQAVLTEIEKEKS